MPPLPDSDSSYAQIDGVAIHHKLLPPNPPRLPLLCLHGFGASLFSFSLALPPLSLLLPSVSPLLFDAPGFGFTSRPLPLRFYTAQFSARIALALADAYAPSRPFLCCAHSMGALAAARLALLQPTRCAALVLIAPALVPKAQLPVPVRMAARGGLGVLAYVAVLGSYVLGPVLGLLLRRVVTSRDFWEKGLALARTTAVPGAVVDGYFAPTGAAGWDRGVLNFCRAALIDRARALGEAEDFVEMLAALGARRPRVLIVHGELDRVVPVENSRMLADKVGGEVVVMQGVGHVPHEEEPQRFAEVVASFLKKEGVVGGGGEV